MDNLTHSLVGLTLAKAGLERLSPGATALCILAANSPDADILTLVGGRWNYLQHHRGLTHSIAGAASLAVALPLVFCLVDWLIGRFKKSKRVTRLPGLLFASFVATASHPLLDWTNNYGVRFLLPWDARWFYGDLVFIMDPVLWLLLGGAAFLLTAKTRPRLVVWTAVALVPTLLVFLGPTSRGGLTNATPLRIFWIVALVLLVVLFRKDMEKRWGRRVAQAAIVTAAAYVLALGAIHQVALRRASAMASILSYEPTINLAAMPTLANPLRWLCIVETEHASTRFELNLTDNQSRAERLVTYRKPDADAPVVREAERDHRVQVFLGFARFPVLQVSELNCVTQSLVQFADLRYTEPGTNRGTFSLAVPVDCPVTEAAK